MPTLGKRVEGTAVVSISCLQLTQFLCHLTVPARHFCWGWPPSPPPPLLLHCQLLLLSSSSFLPLIGQQMGTGSSCLAQQPLSCRLELPGVVLRAQALQTDRLGSIPHSSP